MAQTPSPVAILGAGFVGAALADALRPADVVLASRSGRPRAPVPEGVACVALDVTDPGVDLGGLAAASSLVFAYAPGRGGDRRALYVDGTARVLQRIEAPLRRIVWLGSTHPERQRLHLTRHHLRGPSGKDSRLATATASGLLWAQSDDRRSRDDM
jgi:nucleoside-diphosphate-sugar epimerase